MRRMGADVRKIIINWSDPQNPLHLPNPRSNCLNFIKVSVNSDNPAGDLCLDTANVAVYDMFHRNGIETRKDISVNLGRIFNHGWTNYIDALASRQFLRGRKHKAIHAAIYKRQTSRTDNRLVSQNSG